MTQITLINSRIVSAKNEAAFRDWAERIGAATAARPGFVGGLRIEQTGGLFHLAYRFRDAAMLDEWEKSSDYRQLQEEAHTFSTPGREVVEGELPWVQLPSEADAPKWKRAVMTFVAVLPIAVAIGAAMRALPRPLPSPVQATITSLILVTALTWLILPRLSRWLKPWVLKDGEGQARVER